MRNFVLFCAAAVTSRDEAAVNSDSTRQEHKTSLMRNVNLQSPSDSQQDAVSDNMTTSEDNFSEIQQASKPIVEKDTEDNQNKITESTTDTDMKDSQHKARTESTVGEDSEADQNKPETNSDLDKNMEDGRNEANLAKDTEDGQSETLSRSARDEAVVNDWTGTLPSNQVNEDTSVTQRDGVGGTADSVEMEADDSGADEMSDEQFLSPAASDSDITESGSPTTEQPSTEMKVVENSVEGSVPWSAKVPLLETEPPAMDSDYEEAVQCEMDEQPSELETVRQNSKELKEESSNAEQHEDGNTSDQTTPVATTAVKPKPM